MSIDVLSLSHEDTRLKKEAYNEYSGPCPDMNCRCQTDGFRVRWNGTKWVFMCRGCWDSTEYLAERDRKRGWGDAISYLRHYRHMSFKQAKALADDGQEPSEMPEPAPRKGLDWRDRDWQDWRTEEMQCYKSQMPDSMALAYARERGLTDETIKTASFGFYEANDVPFLVIPSLNGGRIVTLMRRDLRPDIPSDKRWKEASGSTKELYLADSLARKLPTILCEDVFSALSVLQECGKDNINAVATCGADCCQDVRWLARLARMPLVLVAFDADKSGDENARWWLDRLPNSKRLRPFGGKDANDMLRDSWDVRQWIEDALNEPEQEQELESEMLICSLCGARDDGEMDFRFSDDGLCFCSQECLEREQARQAHIAALDELFSIGDAS